MMVNKNPSISVVIPTYNSSSFLPATINAALNQANIDVEILVVDDCSDDQQCLVDLIRSLDDRRIKLILNKNKTNAANCRNIGINAAKNDFVALLDADDRWHPYKLSMQIKQLGVNSIVSCESVVFNEKIPAKFNIQSGFRDVRRIETEMFSSVFPELFLQTSTLLFRKSEVGLAPFDIELERHQDFQFILQCSVKGLTAKILKATLNAYFHRPGVIKTKNWQIESSEKFLRTYLMQLPLAQRQNFVISNLMINSIYSGVFFQWLKVCWRNGLINQFFLYKVISIILYRIKFKIKNA